MDLMSLVKVSLGLYLVWRMALALWRYFQFAWAASKIPGLPERRLLLGDLWFSTYDEHMEVAMRHVQKTGARIYTIWAYRWYPVFSVCHPDTVKLILKPSSPLPKSHGFGSGYELMVPWIGEGLLSSAGGKRWERNRRLLTPAFHFDILKEYVKKFNDVAEDLLIQLSKEDRNKSIEITQPVTQATLDALLRCSCSYNGNIQENGQDHPYAAAVHRMSKLFINRLGNPFLYPIFIYKRTEAGRQFLDLCDYVHRFANDIIAARKQTLRSKSVSHGNARRVDFLDILLTAKDENGIGLTDGEIREEVDTFMFAGHDTTSSALYWTIYALGKHQEMQERVYKEVVEVINDGEVTWDDLPRLKYTQNFIKEVLRMHSVVPFIGRQLDAPITVDGVTLPKGSLVEININCMNHNPSVWPDHDVFRPDRFDDVSLDRDPFSFVPFSAGSRNCIGQNFAMYELKVMTSRLVQNFRIMPDDTCKIVPSPALVMRAKHGIRVFLHPR